MNTRLFTNSFTIFLPEWKELVGDRPKACILSWLDSWQDRQSWVWTSGKYLARMTGYSRSTISKHLLELVEAGWLIRRCAHRFEGDRAYSYAINGRKIWEVLLRETIARWREVVNGSIAYCRAALGFWGTPASSGAIAKDNPILLSEMEDAKSQDREVVVKQKEPREPREPRELEKPQKSGTDKQPRTKQPRTKQPRDWKSGQGFDGSALEGTNPQQVSPQQTERQSSSPQRSTQGDSSSQRHSPKGSRPLGSAIAGIAGIVQNLYPVRKESEGDRDSAGTDSVGVSGTGTGTDRPNSSSEYRLESYFFLGDTRLDKLADCDRDRLMRAASKALALKVEPSQKLVNAFFSKHPVRVARSVNAAVKSSLNTVIHSPTGYLMTAIREDWGDWRDDENTGIKADDGAVKAMQLARKSGEALGGLSYFFDTYGEDSWEGVAQKYGYSPEEIERFKAMEVEF